MSTEEEFTPEFGPNGAVLNAPTITPEMRKQIENAKPPQPKWKQITFFGGMFALLFSSSLLKGNPAVWRDQHHWLLAAYGVFVAVACAVMVSPIVIHDLSRWEILGVTRKNRELKIPMWGRLLLAGLSLMTLICISLAFFWMVVSTKRAPQFAELVTLAVALSAAITSRLLQWLAPRWFGWEIVPPSAPRAATPAS